MASKKKNKRRSGLETKFEELLRKHGVKADYEAQRFEYTKLHHYTPDWRIHDTLFIETKGFFSPGDRGDLRAFREQHPNIEIFLVFGRGSNKLNRNSKTTYRDWAVKHGFRCCDITDIEVILKLFTEKNNNGKRKSKNS